MGTRWNYTYCKASSLCKCDKNIFSVNEYQIWSVPFLEFFFSGVLQGHLSFSFKSLTNVRFPRTVSFISSGSWKPMISSWIFSQVVAVIFLIISRFVLAFSYHLQQNIFFHSLLSSLPPDTFITGVKSSGCQSFTSPNTDKEECLNKSLQRQAPLEGDSSALS